MQVSVETTSELSRKVTVQVPEETIQEKVTARLQSLARETRLDGFRPGKAPQSLIKRRYGRQVREEVLAELIQSSFYDAVKVENLKPVGGPDIRARETAEGKGLAYEANFEVYPEFRLTALENLDLTRPVSDITDEDVQTTIKRLREQRKDWRAVERVAEKGDRLTLEFEGKTDEGSFTEGKKETLTVILGSGQTIPGFDDQLVGTATGQHLDFDLPFPENYGNSALAGKRAEFSIDVVKIEEGIIPEVGAEFAKSYGVEDGDVDTLLTRIRTNLQQELDRALRAKTKEAVMEALLASNPVAVPNTLVEQELRRMTADYLQAAKKNGGNFDEDAFDAGTFQQRIEPLARRRVALGLILAELVRENNLSVDKKRVRESIESMAMGYQQPEEVINWYYSQPEQLSQIETAVLEDQVVDLVLARAKVHEEKLSFDGLTQPAHAHDHDEQGKCDV
jgi:trigger factor